MPAIYEHRHFVRADEVDLFGHVNNLAYMRWLQDAAVAHSAAQGWPVTRYRDLDEGWVVRSHYIEYKAAAFQDDAIVVRTWVADMRRMTSLRKYEIRRESDGVLLARAETNWAYVIMSTLKLARVPDEVIGSFEIVEDGAEK
jgi:acyl-CoA thioester hydrolase